MSIQETVKRLVDEAGEEAGTINHKMDGMRFPFLAVYTGKSQHEPTSTKKGIRHDFITTSHLGDLVKVHSGQFRDRRYGRVSNVFEGRLVNSETMQEYGPMLTLLYGSFYPYTRVKGN